jgi:hypothetical protein
MPPRTKSLPFSPGTEKGQRSGLRCSPGIVVFWKEGQGDPKTGSLTSESKKIKKKVNGKGIKLPELLTRGNRNFHLLKMLFPQLYGYSLTSL